VLNTVVHHNWIIYRKAIEMNHLAQEPQPTITNFDIYFERRFLSKYLYLEACHYFPCTRFISWLQFNDFGQLIITDTSIADWLADFEEHNEKGLLLLPPSFRTEKENQQHSTALFHFQPLKVVMTAAKWCREVIIFHCTFLN
jgi:hypothetical protein